MYVSTDIFLVNFQKMLRCSIPALLGRGIKDVYSFNVCSGSMWPESHGIERAWLIMRGVVQYKAREHVQWNS
jgi:hypothetical protein